MQLILVRHAAAEPDPATHPALWPLTDAGRAAARALARERVWRRVVHVFSSPELKAHETAQIVAVPNGLGVTLVEELREVRRRVGQWLDEGSPGGYAGAVADYFARPDAATHGWEPPAAARARIRACIDEVRGWERGPVAVVGHGLTFSLYLAAVTNGDPAAIWPTIGFPDLAVVDPERGRLVRPFGRWTATVADD